MTRYILVGLGSGMLWGILDGLINANPLARKLLDFYQPLARTKLNVLAAMLIDLLYGFVMAWIFLMLYNSLPGASGWTKGISFGLIVWFFRVVMYVASQWVVIKMPWTAALYLVLSGLAEMVILGLVYGFFLG